MVRRMAGRVHHPQAPVARGHVLPVTDGAPVDPVARIVLGPRNLDELGRRPALGQPRAPRRVVDVRMRHHHPHQPRRAEPPLQLRHVPRVAHGGVDERRLAAGKQVGVVAGAGVGTRIEAGHEDHVHVVRTGRLTARGAL